MTDHGTAAIVLSVVVPLHNEEDNVARLVERLTKVLDGIGEPYEIVLIDDGSTDGTWAVTTVLAQPHSPIRGLGLSRNFGHQNALLAGLSHARGAAVISMDGDLQHPPEMIPELVTAWKKGSKVVTTERRDRSVGSPFKRTTSKLFYKLFSAMAEVPLMEGSSDFRLMDRQPLDTLLSFKDADLFLRGAAQWIGFSQTSVSYDVGDRVAGQTKYSLGRMAKFASSALVSFSTKPLRIGVWLGIVTSSLAFLEIIYSIVQYFRGVTVPGWASIVGVFSFLFGSLFIMLGIIGSYLASIHRVLQNRPRFIVERSVGMEKNNPINMP